MTDLLRLALQHVQEESDKLTPEEQDTLARVLVQLPIPLPPFAGAMPDLPDDIEETMLRRRRDVVPTPFMEEQLSDILRDEA